ncbi:MAG TPA: class I SAM-dependent methyltransferase [Ignavibacteriaceae bacterium]|nr:class I SAM-dependent methyltransferase [Ignavibacteriaceae bacterium]
MADWFKDWFNTDEYLNVYRHRNEAEAKQLVNLIIESIDLPKDSQVLDLACGAGRHSILFALNGYNVTAVDLSDKLLDVAEKSALENNVKIHFIKSDIRKFDSDKRFDLVINLFTSFGYFDNDSENFRLFTLANKLLNPNGFFVLDYLNKLYTENNLVGESIDKYNHKEIIQRRHIENQRVIKNIIIRENGDERSYSESVRMYSKEELTNAITASGLVIENIFGGFDGEKFDEEKSQRIILIAKK